MWQDFGLSEWLFDSDDESQVEEVVPAVLEMAQDPEIAKARAENARRFIEKRQAETMKTVATALM
jgi:hypothetical protein